MDNLIISPKRGGVMINRPTKEFKALHDGKTELEILTALQDVIFKNPQDKANSSVVDGDVALPADLDLRFAWVKTGNSVGVSMPRARTFWLDKINRIWDREKDARVKIITGLDAFGQDSSVERVGLLNTQTAVDNVGPNITAAGTPAMLKAVWPVGLPTE